LALSQDPHLGLRAEHRLIFEHLPEAAYLLEVSLDLRFRTVLVNPAFERLVGLPAEAIVGRYVEETVAPETAVAVVAKYRICALGGEPTELTVRLDLPIGRRLFRSKLVPLRDASGRVAHIVATTRDVTADERLPDARAGVFRTLVEHSSDLVARFDAEARYLYLNPFGLALLQRDWVEIAGRNLNMLPDSRQRVGPEVEVAIRRCVAEGIIVEHEITLVGPDGPRWFHARYTPERDHAGDIVSVVAIARDITALKQAEHEFRTLAEHAPDIIARFNREGRYTYINAAIERLTGLAASSFIGRIPGELRLQLGDLGGPVSVAPLRRAIEAVFATERPGSTEIDLPGLDGPHHLAIQLVPERNAHGTLVSVLAIGSDVTAWQQADRSLRRINRALETLSSGNEALVRATSEAELLDWMCRVLVQVGGRRGAWIGYLGEGGDIEPFEVVASSGLGPPPAAQVNDDRCCSHRLGHEALAKGAPVVVDVPEPLGGDDGRRVLLAGVARVAAAPLYLEGHPLGVLMLYAADHDAFDAEELHLLNELAGDLSYGLTALRLRAEHLDHAARLERAMHATIQALANTLDLRDPYTAGHQRRVTELATALGERLGLDAHRLQGLHFASVVHDIGKIAVPAEILTRPGHLSALEYAIVQTHVEAGYDILKGVDFPWPIAEIVRQHHERLDGSGYPRGLAGESILLEARILAVCDVVEAMSSHRPYRPGLGLDAAFAALESGRGVHFDPQIVDACRAVFVEGHFTFA